MLSGNSLGGKFRVEAVRIDVSTSPKFAFLSTFQVSNHRSEWLPSSVPRFSLGTVQASTGGYLYPSEEIYVFHFCLHIRFHIETCLGKLPKKASEMSTSELYHELPDRMRESLNLDGGGSLYPEELLSEINAVHRRLERERASSSTLPGPFLREVFTVVHEENMRYEWSDFYVLGTFAQLEDANLYVLNSFRKLYAREFIEEHQEFVKLEPDDFFEDGKRCWWIHDDGRLGLVSHDGDYGSFIVNVIRQEVHYASLAV